MRVDEDSAKIGVPPPLLYLGTLLIGVATTGATGRLGPDGAISYLTAGALLLLGVATIAAATIRFGRAHTEARPWRTTTTLVTSGIYRFTRNPMYLGMALVYAAIAVLLNSFTAVLLLPVLILIVQTQVIAREERYLAGKFGADYAAYRQRVARWF